MVEIGEGERRSKSAWFKDVGLKDRDSVPGIEYEDEIDDTANKR